MLALLERYESDNFGSKLYGMLHHWANNIFKLGILRVDECTAILASFPGLFTVQFLIACSMQKLQLHDQKLDGGKAWEQGYSYMYM